MMEGSVQNYLTLGLRSIQILCMASLITGFIWASSDYLLLTVLVESQVTPLSVLLMLYGFIGMGVTEAAIRVVAKKKA